METFWQDVRHGIRLAASRPGFTVVAVVTLALGIGPNTAIFSIVNSILLTPPPFDEPDRIVTTPAMSPGDTRRVTTPSTDDIQDWRAETRTLEAIALYAPDSMTLTGFGDPVRLSGWRVSPSLFPLLGVRPMKGRLFSEDEEKPGMPPVVLISQRLWEQRLGSDASVVGRPIVLNGSQWEVIGIMPASFTFPARETDYWAPFVLAPPERNPNERRIAVVPFVARLKPGVTKEEAAAEGNAIIARNQPPARRGMPAGPAGSGAVPGSGSAGPEGRRGGPETAPVGPGSAGEPGGARRGGAPGAPLAETGGARAGGPGTSPAEPGGARRGGGAGAPLAEPGGARRGGPEAPPAGPGGARAGGPGAPQPGAGPAVERLPLRLVTLQERMNASDRSALGILAAAVGFVLLIACANVANLVLARSTVRGREFAVRAALGAGRRRLVRQLLTEGAVLSVLGGVAGVILAYWAIRLLPRLGTAEVQRLAEVRLDFRVLAFAAVLSLGTTLLFGLAPALAALSGSLAQSLNQRVAASGSRRLPGRPLPGLLTIVQVALALVLVIGAALLTRSFFNLVSQDPGYRPEGALTVQVQLPRSRYPNPRLRAAFLDQALQSIRTIPGVEAAGATNLMPMSQAQIRISFELPGVVTESASDEPLSAGVRLVSSDLFRALGTRLVAGREFTDADGATSEPVMIVNTAFVARYLQGQDALGRQADVNGPRRIVGIVESMKPLGLDSEPMPEMYFPMSQFGQLLMEEGPLAATTLVARTGGDPTSLVPAIRSRISQLDSELPIFNVITLSQRVADSVAAERLYASLLAVFAALALVLASVGIYGVLSAQVAQSTSEIGVRIALGAGPADIRRSVVGRAAALAGIGAAVGMAGAWALSGYIESQLFSVTPFDPPAYAAAAVFLAVAGIAGAWLPARRATMVDPVVALRQE